MAVTLDGSTDYYLRSAGLKGAADGKVGTFACWLKRASTPGSVENLFSISQGSSERFFVRRTAADTIEIGGSNASGSSIMLFASSALATTTDSDYRHLAVSWDLANSNFQVFIDRTSSLGTTTTQTDDNIDYTGDTAALFARSHDGARFWNGDVSEVYLDITTRLDLSSSDVLGRLVSQDNTSNSQGSFLKSEPGDQFKPVGYGHDVSLPTNKRPLVYVSGTSTSMGQNRGTGGDFVMQGTPAFDEGPTSYRHHARFATHGRRWFASDRSGFLYPRQDTFIERREGIPSQGERLGQDERDARTRNERPGITFSSLIFSDREEDTEEWDR